MRITIKAKLASAIGLVMLLSVAIGILAIRDINELDSSFEELLDGPVARVRHGQELELLVSNIAKAEKDMILADTDALMDRYDGEILKARQDMKATQERLRAISTEVGRQDLVPLHREFDWLVLARLKRR